jgi:hypothetical protein
MSGAPGNACRLDLLWANGVPESEWPIICEYVTTGTDVEVFPGSGGPIPPGGGVVQMDCAGFDPNNPNAVCYHFIGDITNYYGNPEEIPCLDNIFYAYEHACTEPENQQQLCGYMLEVLKQFGCPEPEPCNPNEPYGPQNCGTDSCAQEQADYVLEGCTK